MDPAYDIVGTGDFDGDGKSDLLWRHTTLGDVWIWLMDGATPLSEMYIDTVDPAYVVKGVGDLDANGKADIVWHHADAGGGVGVADERRDPAVAALGGDGAGHGLPDRGGGGPHGRREGGPAVASRHAGRSVDLDDGWHDALGGDVGGDGPGHRLPDRRQRRLRRRREADLLWHHATLGEVWVWLMDGTTKLSETWVATVPDVGYRIVK